MPSEDTITSVSNLDIQILNAERAETTTVKLDNPKQNLTREQVSAAMQPALSNGWLLTNKGSVAMYLGDVTYNTSTKVKLGGEDFYVTPASFTFQKVEFSSQGSGDLIGYNDNNPKIQVSGATIQGYNFVDHHSGASANLQGGIYPNGLTFVWHLTSGMTVNAPSSFDIKLTIQGTIVTIPVYITENQ